MMNSYPHGTSYKAPLSNWNQNIWRPLIHKVKEYVLGLRTGSDMRISETGRSACVVGLVVYLTSIESIMDEVVLPQNTSLK